ncbi:glycoside hydrolase family 53 protein [Polaribacter sp. P097]|uniref:glycoside hydrolase family 53 protein n=1 Tax=Polaribacter sp. P097 TaxID=3117398 RepID=UPI002FE1BB99
MLVVVLKKLKFSFFILSIFALFSCSSEKEETDSSSSIVDVNSEEFYLGADLSYVNEMENCGVFYKNKEGKTEDVFKIFAEGGSDLVRVRLWHNPTWTNYSNYEDVEKTIQRAKNTNTKVLLDFHYSDDWVDPEKQKIPKAWLPVIDNLPVLGDSIYNYTYNVLEKLSDKNLLPEMVQVGNEINLMILQKDNNANPMDWPRNSFLLNKGIKAVRDLSKEKNKNIEVMLHIAQPENGLWWFKEAKENGVTDFDWIGLSYYPNWSQYTIQNVAPVLKNLIDTYSKKLMIVETAYPFSLLNADSANNILGTDALITGYEATQAGQLKYLLDLKQAIKTAGGSGLVYWEPAWLSNNCATRWGQGSHWDNATLFDNNAKPTLGFDFYKSE